MELMQAIEDPDGVDTLKALVSSGANVNVPTRVCTTSHGAFWKGWKGSKFSGELQRTLLSIPSN